jgi:dienelactone hydrolase
MGAPSVSACGRRCLARLAVASAAVAAILLGLWQLTASTRELITTEYTVEGVPTTVFRSAGLPPGPPVVIAHGFAGSQQLMHPFAITLAQNGYVAVTFDFPGHGRNPRAFPGGITQELEARAQGLLDALEDVAAFARAQPMSQGPLAVLGHSMAGDVLLDYGIPRSGTDPAEAVEATVAVSPYIDVEVTPQAPRNLLIIVGEWEPDMLVEEARTIVARTAAEPPEAATTYGDFADGTARRFEIAPRVEHIGVLYSEASLGSALDWLNQTYERDSSGFIETRGPWLAVLFLGLIALGWPLSYFLPRVTREPSGIGLGWGRFLPVAIAPALLTPLLLWPIPTDFLPLLLGDYLALHFGLYGILTAIGLWLAHRDDPRTHPARVNYGALSLALIAAIAYSVVAVILPIDRFITSFVPTAGRVPLILVIVGGTLLFFLADAWLTRGRTAPRGAYALTKVAFLVSLFLAILLNLEQLFFLVIILPAILAFFIVYGLVNSWVYRATNHPMIGAVSAGVVFAWAIAVVFPVVGP